MSLSSIAFHKHHSCPGKCRLPASLLPDAGLRGARCLCWSGVEGSRGRKVNCTHLGRVEGKLEGTSVGCSCWLCCSCRLSGKVFARKGSAAQVVVVGSVRGLGAQAKWGGQGNGNPPPPRQAPPWALPVACSPARPLQAPAEISQEEAIQAGSASAGPSALRCATRIRRAWAVQGGLGSPSPGSPQRQAAAARTGAPRPAETW